MTGSGWTYGLDFGWMKLMVDYWLTRYDWGAHQWALNEYPHYISVIDGFRIHYLHFRSKYPNAVPLLITHGWPGSFLELLKVAPMLAESSSDPFDVVVPSLPGYGFSERPPAPGMNTFRTAELWVELMRELGYGRFVAQGGDIGANVSSVMAWKHPESMLALHLNYIPGSYRPWVDEATQPLCPEEIDAYREAKLPVFFFLDSDDTEYFEPTSPSFKLMDFINPQKGEPVIVKTSRNCFTTTNLDYPLRRSAVRRGSSRVSKLSNAAKLPRASHRIWGTT